MGKSSTFLIFLKVWSIFPLIFPQTLLIFFLILAFRVGESLTPEGPDYPTVSNRYPIPLEPRNMCMTRWWVFNLPIAPHIVHKSVEFRGVGLFVLHASVASLIWRDAGHLIQKTETMGPLFHSSSSSAWPRLLPMIVGTEDWIKYHHSDEVCCSRIYEAINVSKSDLFLEKELLLDTSRMNFLMGYCTSGPYFWRLCAFSHKIKQLRTKYSMDLVRNVPRNSKITVLLQ